MGRLTPEKHFPVPSSPPPSTLTSKADVSLATLVDLDSSPELGKRFLSQKFEYIIAGGGTSGLALARRLSEKYPKKRILVLEAGGSGVDRPVVTVPQRSFSFIATDIDWLYTAYPQVHASNQSINLSSGKVLGGGSAVNGLVWSRPPKKDWDDFAQLGSPGWDWETLFKSSRKSETVNAPAAPFARVYGYTIEPTSHGHSGPVDASYPPYIPLQYLKFIDAALELGHPLNPDPYAGNNTGVSFSLSSQTPRNTRETSEFAYLDPVLHSKNLLVCIHALVTKLDISSAPKGQIKSTGVEVKFPDGSLVSVKIKSHGEVILSAGAIRTPQLLELSGIGNKEILRKLNIPVKLDLPGVGENYKDHPITIMTYKLKPPFLSFDAFAFNATLKQEQQELYEKKRLGWLTFAQGVLNFATAQTILNEKELQVADKLLQIKPDGISQEEFDLTKKKIFDGIPQVEYFMFNTFSAGSNKENNTNYVSLAISTHHPLSRGSIHINTTSIDDHPKINPNVLKSEWDTWFLAKATAYGRRFSETVSFKEIIDEEVFPGLDVQTDEQWQQFIKDTINIDYHSCGTASLLPREKNGVVDPNLKVYGTTNIRVVDTSIMPLLIAAHLQITAYAIAERAADIIRLT
ncbi:CAZyme family AA3 [Agaricus bisporus var. burnettii]|uniref:pyranose dehydrogenase (acceptor) n=1 Tax=Agaricus bisporus var. burnettii TaxID=192524 RepID=A0A8H7EV26_AGABI|nr:CAZyme family AA3 [Agaricus bisporus var. burnettii]